MARVITRIAVALTRSSRSSRCARSSSPAPPSPSDVAAVLGASRPRQSCDAAQRTDAAMRNQGCDGTATDYSTTRHSSPMRSTLQRLRQPHCSRPHGVPRPLLCIVTAPLLHFDSAFLHPHRVITFASVILSAPAMPNARTPLRRTQSTAATTGEEPTTTATGAIRCAECRCCCVSPLDDASAAASSPTLSRVCRRASIPFVVRGADDRALLLCVLLSPAEPVQRWACWMIGERMRSRVSVTAVAAWAAIVTLCAVLCVDANASASAASFSDSPDSLAIDGLAAVQLQLSSHLTAQLVEATLLPPHAAAAAANHNGNKTRTAAPAAAAAAAARRRLPVSTKAPRARAAAPKRTAAVKPKSMARPKAQAQGATPANKKKQPARSGTLQSRAAKAVRAVTTKTVAAASRARSAKPAKAQSQAPKRKPASASAAGSPSVGSAAWLRLPPPKRRPTNVIVPPRSPPKAQKATQKKPKKKRNLRGFVLGATRSQSIERSALSTSKEATSKRGAVDLEGTVRAGSAEASRAMGVTCDGTGCVSSVSGSVEGNVAKLSGSASKSSKNGRHTVGLDAMGKIGADATVGAAVAWNKGGAGAKASVSGGAFVGAKAEATASYSNRFFTASGTVSGSAGAGVEAEAAFQAKDGRLRFSGEMAAAVGLGSGVGGSVEINVGEVARAARAKAARLDQLRVSGMRAAAAKRDQALTRATTLAKVLHTRGSAWFQDDDGRRGAGATASATAAAFIEAQFGTEAEAANASAATTATMTNDQLQSLAAAASSHRLLALLLSTDVHSQPDLAAFVQWLTSPIASEVDASVRADKAGLRMALRDNLSMLAIGSH